MIIRRATQEDKETLWLIQTQAIRELGTSHYNPEQIMAWSGMLTPEESHSRAMERFSQSIEDDAVFVAEDADGTVAGFASLHAQSGEVAAVYVHPAYARQGIGMQLFMVLEEEARRLGVVTLNVKASLNAVAFYERAGFKLEHEAIHHFRSGIEMPCTIMTKIL